MFDYFKSKEEKLEIDRVNMRQAVITAREELEVVKGLNLMDGEAANAGHNILNACCKLLEMFPTLWFKGPAIKDALDQIRSINFSLDPNSPIEEIQNAVIKVQDTCMWLDLNYDLGAYPTFIQGNEVEKALDTTFKADPGKTNTHLIHLRRRTVFDIPQIEYLEQTYFPNPADRSRILELRSFVAETNAGDGINPNYQFCGHALFSVRTNDIDIVPAMKIESIAVEPNRLKRGIGTSLLLHLVNEAQRLGLHEIHAHLGDPGHPAKDFFLNNMFWEGASASYDQGSGLLLVKHLPHQFW